MQGVTLISLPLTLPFSPLYLSLLPSLVPSLPAFVYPALSRCLSDECFILRPTFSHSPRSQSRVSPVIISLYSPSSPYRRHSSHRWNYMQFQMGATALRPHPRPQRRGGRGLERGGGRGELVGLGKDKSSVLPVGDCKAWLG